MSDCKFHQPSYECSYHVFPCNATVSNRGNHSVKTSDNLYFAGNMRFTCGPAVQYGRNRLIERGNVSPAQTMLTPGNENRFKVRLPHGPDFLQPAHTHEI